MLASMARFVPRFGDGEGEGGEIPIPAERPYTLGAASMRVAARPPSSNIATAGTAERSLVRLPVAGSQKATDADSAPAAGPVAAYALGRNDGILGMMSGRGLY